MEVVTDDGPGGYVVRRLLPAVFVLPVLLAIAKANPFAILFESYRAVIYGTPEGGSALPQH